MTNANILHDLAPDFLENCFATMKEAGKVILNYYDFDKFKVTTKDDNSPLTSADIASHEIINKSLKLFYPNIPIVSEEQKNLPFGTRKTWETFWLIDPIDGTKEFIDKNDEFTVNIALVHKGKAIFGMIYAPALDVLYYGFDDSAYKINDFSKAENIFNEIRIIKARKFSENNVVIAVSRRHSKEKFQKLKESIFPNATTIPKGSSLKMCLIAEGLADIYIRLGPTSEWDTAAGQAILNGAGGEIFDIHSNILRYNTKESLLNPEFYAIGDMQVNWKNYLNELPE